MVTKQLPMMYRYTKLWEKKTREEKMRYMLKQWADDIFDVPMNRVERQLMRDTCKKIQHLFPTHSEAYSLVDSSSIVYESLGHSCIPILQQQNYSTDAVLHVSSRLYLFLVAVEESWTRKY